MSGMTFIEEIVVGAGGIATIDFDNIPATFDHLVIQYQTQAETGSAAAVIGWFNSDTTAANYFNQRLSSQNSSTTSTKTDSFSFFAVANASGASQPAHGVIEIPYYTSGLRKAALGRVGWHDGSNNTIDSLYTLWTNSSVIDRIRLVCNGGADFKEGSLFALYGITGATTDKKISELTAVTSLVAADEFVLNKSGVGSRKITAANLMGQLGGFSNYESRSTNTILGVADRGKVIDITATITQTFEADETLGDGWCVLLRNATDDGTVVVTLDPAGSETIDGIANPKMYAGETRLIMCNGTGANFNSVMLTGGYARFDANDNFRIPAGVTRIIANPVGAGGGGAGGRGAAAGNLRQGGGGGGGGAGPLFELRLDDVGAPGDDIAITMGTGGAGGGGGSNANGSNGSPGGSTTFGNYLAFGGGGGGGGQSGASTAGVTGGGGGGINAAGGVGANGAHAQGGGAPSAGIYGHAEYGAGCNFDSPFFAGAFNGVNGGASGGGARGDAGSASSVGGCSVTGGGGGGGGGGVSTGNTERTGGAGGGTGRFTTAAIGGTAGAVNGGAGGNGTDFGDGGGGGGGQDSGTGGAGGNGAVGGGGGGAGGGGTTTGGTGGTGGNGGCRVWYE